MTNGVSGNNHPDESTRRLDDAEWFWTRAASEETAQPEPTQVIPGAVGAQDSVEPTIQLPQAEMPLALSAAIGSAAATAAHPSAPQPGVAGPRAGQQGGQRPTGPQLAAWAPPTGVPAASTSPSTARRSGGPNALLAVFAASLMTGMAVLQAPALARTAGELLPGGQTSTQPAPTQEDPGTQTGGTQTGGTQTGGTQDGSGTPAEEEPWDPWGVDEQDPQDEQDQEDQQGTTNEQSTGASQASVTSAQGKGVVLIEATTASGRSAGTGMVVTDNGYVLTNYHVVQSSTALRVQLASSQKTYQATVVGHDASNDVALLKLEGAEGLQTVTLDDDQLSTGDAVTAVGNANGQGHLSAAAGTVTDLTSSITVSNETSSSGKEELSDVIKTTAGAQPGDSGGPMFDAEGEVVGMTTAGQQASSGIRTQNTTVASYAVPIERAMGIITQIRSGNESGTVKVGPNAYLGVSVRTLDDGSISVASVVSGGPAATAGLSRGDTITSLDQTSITSHAVLSEVLAGKEPGDRVTMTWLDGSSGARRSAEVTLGSSPMN